MKAYSRPYLFFLAALVALMIPLKSGEASASKLRICADPDYMPFSNRAGEGLENKLAEVVAKALGDEVEYTWASYRGRGGFDGFLYETLNAHKCDVVMEIPYGSAEALTTQPYYVSSYVFVFKKDKDYDIRSMDSPVLRKLKIGFEYDTPPETGLKLRGLVLDATPFRIGDTAGLSPEIMLDAVEKGTLDVAITWEPAIGYFLPKYPDLQVVAVPNERTYGAPEQYSFPISMGVRKGDETTKKRLDEVINTHHDEIVAVLNQFGVKLYQPDVPGVRSY